MDAKTDDIDTGEEVSRVLTRLVTEVADKDPIPRRLEDQSNYESSTTELIKTAEQSTEEFATTETAKDMVVLRNLEITPPPPNPAEEQHATWESNANNNNDGDTQDPLPTKEGQAKRIKRKSAESDTSLNQNGSTEITKRSKRQRTQTRLFQAGDAAAASSSSLDEITSSPEKPVSRRPPAKRKSNARQSNPKAPPASKHSTSSSSMAPAQSNSIIPIIGDEQQDVIIWDKNDYVAVRNEDDSFYLAQLMEDVRRTRPFIKVKWLDTTDGGKTYHLTDQRDSIPTQSILIACSLRKLESKKKGEQIFELTNEDRENIMERLKKSLSVRTEQFSSSQETIVGSGNEQ